MFEINLIRDRVVPISKKLLRTFILSAYFILVIFATIVIMLLSMNWESKIDKKLKDIEVVRKAMEETEIDMKNYLIDWKNANTKYRKLEKLKAPWDNKIFISHLIYHLVIIWDKTDDLKKFANISVIEYDANVHISKPESGKIIVIGFLKDEPGNPIPAPPEPMKLFNFTNKTIEALVANLLGDVEFLQNTKIKNISFECRSNSYKKNKNVKRSQKGICYFKLTMETEIPLYVSEEEVADKTESSKTKK